MIAGIMQPYFFPYFGYFDHISLCDTWVVFDISQYTPKSWMTRNRIQHPSTGWQYINCDVHGSQNTCIAFVRLLDVKKTRGKVLGQLAHYKKHAPYYVHVVDIVERAFDAARSTRLTDITVSGLAAVCTYLCIPFAPIIASEADFQLPPITHPGQWSLEISTLLGAETYLNTPGGRHLFRPEEFAMRGIRLGFTGVPHFEYECKPYIYEPHLSILDVLMWNSPEQVRAQLRKTPVGFV